MTGAAGFIGSHLAAKLLDEGAHVIGLDCFADYYPRAVKEAESVVARRAGRGSRSSRRGFRTPISRACSTASPTSSIWRRRPACGKAGDASSTSIPPTTSRRPRCCSRPAWGGRSSDSSTRRARRSTATTCRCRCRKTRASSRCPRTASPSWRPSTLRRSTGRTTACRRSRCGTSPFTGLASGPTWGFTGSCARRSGASRSSIYGDGEQTRDFTFVADIVAATVAAGLRGERGAVYNIGGGSRVTINDVLDLIGRVTGRPVSIERAPRSEGGHAPHVRRHLARPARLGFAPSVSLEEGLSEQYRWHQTGLARG